MPCGQLLNFDMDKLGGQIRPKSFRDKDKSAKRGQIWLCALVTVIAAISAILWYAAQDTTH